MLWLALHFPLLSLEALPLRQSPSAVVAGGRVLAVDPMAAAAGAEIGQKRSTALGLVPGLRLFARDPACEVRALDDLACWAGQFTPVVVPMPPDALLLEIGGCLRLFGGVPALVDAVLAGCTGQGWSTAWAAAPTPLAAYWLARAERALVVREPGELPATLAALPLTAPGWSAAVIARLESFGLRCLGDLAALPVAGLRARIGNAAVDELLRARGDLPDPQRAFVFPERFATRLELPSRVEHAEALAFAGQRLFAALAGWLAARQLLVRRCTLHLAHDDGSLSDLALRLGEPSADEGRLLRLLREHLGRLQLAAPVEGLALVADETVARPAASGGLFDRAIPGEGRLACLERLRARFGEDAVRLPGLRADHRPECATVDDVPPADSAPGPVSTAAAPVRRPLWLLDIPQPLVERDGRPHWHGPLHWVTRAERLESGWWDSGESGAAGDIRRDYFVARNRHGQWGWIFRDTEGWFLHGLFA